MNSGTSTLIPGSSLGIRMHRQACTTISRYARLHCWALEGHAAWVGLACSPCCALSTCFSCAQRQLVEPGQANDSGMVASALCMERVPHGTSGTALMQCGVAVRSRAQKPARGSATSGMRPRASACPLRGLSQSFQRPYALPCVEPGRALANQSLLASHPCLPGSNHVAPEHAHGW